MRINQLCSAALLLCAAGLAGCDGGPSDPGELPQGELVFVRAASYAPPLETSQVQVWAKAGEGRRVEIRYKKPDGSSGGDRCLEFNIPGDGLLARPGGGTFAKGDSVLITIRVMDPSTFSFEFAPAGLRFNPEHPAELRISYKWADPDRNGDGRVDDRDRDFGYEIWRQESEGANWYRIGTSRESSLEDLRSDEQRTLSG